MYKKRSHQVGVRIVSINHTHAHLIVHGKAKVGTESGTKINISLLEDMPGQTIFTGMPSMRG